MATSRLRILLALALATALSRRAEAGDFKPPPELTLQAADGSAVTLDALRAGHDATVLVFWSGSCPCVRRYQERVDALLDAYPPERVRVVAVSSNVGESFEEALRVARERGVRVPLYRDEGARLADALGAKTTPTVVLLDAKGTVRYQGWLDNERLSGDRKREAWLDRAIAGVLEGRKFASKSPVYGCRITRSIFGNASEKPGSCCSVAK